jgi:hypothetical protein
MDGASTIRLVPSSQSGSVSQTGCCLQNAYRPFQESGAIGGSSKREACTFDWWIENLAIWCNPHGGE